MVQFGFVLYVMWLTETLYQLNIVVYKLTTYKTTLYEYLVWCITDELILKLKKMNEVIRQNSFHFHHCYLYEIKIKHFGYCGLFRLAFHIPMSSWKWWKWNDTVQLFRLSLKLFNIRCPLIYFVDKLGSR